MKSKNIRSASRQLKLLTISAIIIMSFSLPEDVAAQTKIPLVHIAKITVDPAKLESYKAALKENADASIRIEPGVLTLYGVSDKTDPTHITVFEIYADTAAYKLHRNRSTLKSTRIL